MNSIRAEFPILGREVNGKPLIYLDNAATTQKPKAVIEAEKKFYEESNANIHRGIHTLAEESTALYEKTRELTAEFLNASKDEIVFTKNCTESINLVAYSWAHAFLKEGDAILLSIMEHHANWVPWHELARQYGWRIEYVDIKDDGTLNLEDLKQKVEKSVKSLKSKIKLVAVTHQSNVLGTINPIDEIIKIAHEHKAKVLVDAAQSVSHIPIDMKKLDVDFLAFSAHKMFGPTGVGVLYAKKELLHQMPPFLMGGDMIKSVSKEEILWNDSPWKFEAGTPNTAGVIAFGEALRFISSLTLSLIDEHVKKLTTYALQELGKIEKLILYGPKDSKVSRGIMSFNLAGVHAHDVASILDEEGIAIRSGAHCAHPLMKRLGVDSTARASFSIYNDKNDVDRLVEGIKKVKKIFRV